MTPKNKREKVVAEITPAYVMRVVRQQGRFLNQRQALAFLNEGNRAYIMWKQMMYAAENYVASVLVDSDSGTPTLTSCRGARGRSLGPQNRGVSGRHYSRLLMGTRRTRECESQVRAL